MQAQVFENEQRVVALPLRAHTIFGVCEGLGEDFGINPTWIRIPFAAAVLISPTVAIGAYLAAGLVVLASRLIFPKAKIETVEQGTVEAAAPANEQRELARAA